MNRAQRRKARKVEPILKITPSELEEYKQQAKWQAYKKIESGLKEKAERSASEVLKSLFGLTLMTMEREYDWKQKRLNRLFDQLARTHGEFEQGAITMEDLEVFMRDKVGIKEGN